MATTAQDWTRKIAALLRKAEGTDNENEAAAFLAKAQELMIQHAIDEQALRDAQPTAQRTAPVKRDFMYSPDGKNATGKASLMGVAARESGCVSYIYGGSWNVRREGGAHARWGVIVGFEADIEAAIMLYQSLLIQALRFGVEAYATSGVYAVGKSRFLTGFVMGFARRVGQRLHDARTDATTATNSTALIVRRDQEVRDAAKEFFPTLGKGRSQTVDGMGLAAGWTAGARADIGQPKVAAAARRLASGK